MTEPVTSALGIKLSSTIAGFAGGVVSLAFVQGLSRMQAIMAVVVGSLTAAYLTPAVVAKLSISPELQSGAAFVIGLCAMSIIPAIKRAVARRAEALPGTDNQGAPK
ncbi:MAG TPA: peptidase M48, Ste24p [Frateuria sp.]|uniref:peptidase M48, Ste24p n=1 Tax=Frateuria sp. TaxID=2211372 RepID=UPI002DE6154D|nr:peptidase M48, Ste24p [Frateuria sp.]